ncbi:hypothetical protein EBR21_08855, partial [bacterium]|nr:hypothetical protein [bacterium]
SAPIAESAASWPADYWHPFDIEISSTDKYGNPARGPASVEIIATNPRNVSLQNGTPVGTSPCMFQPSAFPAPPAGWEGMTPSWRNTGYRVSLDNPEGRWSGSVWYCYGHTVDISAVVGSASIERVSTIRFVPTLATVNGFHILSSSTPWTTTNVTAGENNLNLDILAYSAGQQVYGLDSELNSTLASLNWQGKFDGGVEKRGTVRMNTLGTPSAFVNGKSSVVHSIYEAKDYGPFTMTLEMSGTSLGNHPWSALGRQQTQITVNPGPFDELLVRLYAQNSNYIYPSDQNATPPEFPTGTARTVEAYPTDAIGNPVLTGCGTAMQLQPSANYDAPGGHGGSAASAIVSALNLDPATRRYRGNIQLFKNSLHEFNLTGCPNTRSVKMDIKAIVPNSIVLSRINDPALASHTASITCPNLPGTISASDQRSKPDVLCPALYSFAWDAWGNPIGTNGNMRTAACGASTTSQAYRPRFLRVCLQAPNTMRYLLRQGSLTAKSDAPRPTNMEHP